MKKFILRTNVMDVVFIGVLVTGMLAVPQSALSQVEEEDVEEVTGEMEEVLQEVEEQGEQIEEKLEELWEEVEVEVKKTGGKPRFGLYLEDIDFEDAYEMHYPENYGVLIDGVVGGGSADGAGLREGDIIMEFDGEKVRYEDHLLRMRNSKRIGDTVQMKFFRDEKVMTTNLIFYPPKEDGSESGDVPDEIGKRLSPGYGGGGFEPILIDFDFNGINSFLKVNEFDPIDGGLVFSWGGGGAGNVGKGWFIGGMGAGFERRQQVAIKNASGEVVAWKAYRLESGFGGVTLQKKIPLFTDRFVLDAGIMLGGGGTTLIVSQTDGDVTWGSDIETKKSYSVRFEKGYFVYRPSVGLLVRIKNWVGIHGSVGYLGTYADDAKWTEKPFDFTVGGISPAVPSGLSFTLGFWFGY